MMYVSQMAVYQTNLEVCNGMNNSSSDQILSKFTHHHKHSVNQTANKDIKVPKKKENRKNGKVFS